uniref:NAD-dependent epimerase/dehydratase domain-containing protein n=1 Tax=Zea mays TaxID=4577 RepID=A0A804LUZ3_MAIZE
MLGLAKRVRARILLTSTSEVYGDPLEHPQTEAYWGNVNPIGVRSCYDEGKRVAETLMFDYHRQHGIEIRIARIFNTYGPRMNIDDGRVVSNFIAQAVRGEPLTVQRPGTQTRSFCYVADMVCLPLHSQLVCCWSKDCQCTISTMPFIALYQLCHSTAFPSIYYQCHPLQRMGIYLVKVLK